MTGGRVEIVPCPERLVSEALALALCHLAPEQRREIAPQLPGDGRRLDELVVAIKDGQLCGATWGQHQPGNTAIVWPPQLSADVDRGVAEQLAGAVVNSLDQAGVRFAQVVLPDREAAIIPVLESVGFCFLADLLYLSWEASLGPPRENAISELEFEPVDLSQRDRLMHIVERTYQGTRDCAAMNGLRPIEEVIGGYEATGGKSAANWMFVRSEDRDAGVLLLASHAQAEHWELVYMGLLPEFRGRQWGVEIVREAQRRAWHAKIERIVLAVDAINMPALAMYAATGFQAWEKRTVYTRIGRGAT